MVCNELCSLAKRMGHPSSTVGIFQSWKDRGATKCDMKRSECCGVMNGRSVGKQNLREVIVPINLVVTYYLG